MSNIELIQLVLMIMTLGLALVQGFAIIDLRIQVEELNKQRAQLQIELEQLKAQIINKE